MTFTDKQIESLVNSGFVVRRNHDEFTDHRRHGDMQSVYLVVGSPAMTNTPHDMEIEVTRQVFLLLNNLSQNTR